MPSTGASGRCRGSAKRWPYRGPAFTPGCMAGRAPRAQFDEQLTAKVRTSFVGSARTYGARRVWRDVLAEGAALRPPQDRATDARQRLSGATASPWTAEGRRTTLARRGAQCPRSAICCGAAEPEVDRRLQCAAASGVRDGDRSPAISLQERVANHRKRRWSKARVVSVTEKALQRRQVGDRKANTREPPYKCRKLSDDVETGE